MCTIYIAWPLIAPEPDVCPGCGHCRQCGRYVGIPAQPVYPVSPVYPQTPVAPHPYIGDPSPSDWPTIIVSDGTGVAPLTVGPEEAGVVPLAVGGPPPMAGRWSIGDGAADVVTVYSMAL